MFGSLLGWQVKIIALCSFKPPPSPKLLIPPKKTKNKKHWKQGEYLPGYLFLPLGEALGSPKANLAHPNFVIFSHSAQT